MNNSVNVGKSIGVALSGRQLFFASNPQGKRTNAKITEFLDSFEVLPQNEYSFVGSDEILNHLFEVINRQVFNANLDGIELEWCDKLTSRAVIAYESITYATHQTYIRCSKAWFGNRSRQQFVEAILYELIHLYVRMRGTDEETSPDLMAYLIHAGLFYFNSVYDMNLVLNNNYKKGHTNYKEDDMEELSEILESILKERRASTGKISGFTLPPVVKLLSQRINGNMNAVKCNAEGGCGGFCYGSGCPAAGALRDRYLGANIYFLFTIDRPIQCFLCDNKVKKVTLKAHFNKDCKAFGRQRKTADHTLLL